MANPFVKKRLIDEISNAKVEPPQPAHNATEDVEMKETPNDSGSKELAQKFAEASVNESLPAVHTAEDDWIKLKI